MNSFQFALRAASSGFLATEQSLPVMRSYEVAHCSLVRVYRAPFLLQVFA